MYTGWELAFSSVLSGLRVLVVSLSDLKQMFEASDEFGRSRSRVKTRV